MQIIFRLSLVVILSIANVSISSAGELVAPTAAKQNSELQLLKDQVIMLEKSLTEVQKNQYGGADNSSVNRLNATTIAQLEEIREQIRGLRGDIEQLQFDNARSNEKLIKMAADFEHRLSELGKEGGGISTVGVFEELDENLDNDLILQQNDAKANKSRNASKKELNNRPGEITALVREQEMQKLYDDAYSSLKSKKIKDALEQFRTFVEEYPDTDLSGNAYYWIGEIYFQKRKFDKSAIEYLRGYQANIRGSRAADNLLKLGMSLSKLEKRKESCTTFMKLEKEFPNTTNMIKKKNAAEMEKLRCKS